MRFTRAASVLIAVALVAVSCGRTQSTTTTDSTSTSQVRDDLYAPGSVPAPKPAEPDTAPDATAPQPLAGNPADFVRVSAPLADAIVSSPLFVTGEARGPWYFEADFPVRLIDEAGTTLAIGVAQAKGDWMTERFVPFQARLTFGEPKGEKGALVLERSNPSGDVKNAAELRIPVRFR